jgi:hypothetical protein
LGDSAVCEDTPHSCHSIIRVVLCWLKTLALDSAANQVPFFLDTTMQLLLKLRAVQTKSNTEVDILRSALEYNCRIVALVRLHSCHVMRSNQDVSPIYNNRLQHFQAFALLLCAPL